MESEEAGGVEVRDVMLFGHVPRCPVCFFRGEDGRLLMGAVGEGHGEEVEDGQKEVVHCGGIESYDGADALCWTVVGM